jgi:hypothetical protein
VNRWFSGAFTYHLPVDLFAGVVKDKRLAVAQKLLGGDVDPEVLWDLAPWSWAVDWFSSVGDVIHNLSAYAKDGLVVRYGYIMEHSIVRDTYSYSGDLGLIPEAKFTGRPADLVLVSEKKLRRRSSPFGFGLALSELTTRQKAIVAALGLSRIKQ